MDNMQVLRTLAFASFSNLHILSNPENLLHRIIKLNALKGFHRDSSGSNEETRDSGCNLVNGPKVS
jgi:hypothetical protein